MRKKTRIPSDALPLPRDARAQKSPPSVNHRATIRKSVWFAWVAFIVRATCPLLPALAEEPVVEIVTQNSVPAADESFANLAQPVPRLQIFTQFHTGYDDNFRTRPQAEGAWFTDEKITLSYRAPSQNMQLSVIGGGGAVNYLGERTDANGFLDLSFARKLSRRMTLNASLDARYLSEPDLTSNIGPNRFSGSYFRTDDRFWLDYELSRRLSTVTRYNFELIRYQDEARAAASDREQHTIGEQLRFDLTSTAVLTGEYRVLLVDYVTAPNDSTTQFLLAGMQYRFSPRFHGQFQAGASIRSFETGGSQVKPDFEGSLDYALGRRSSLSWTGSYSVGEQSDVGSVTRTTLQTSLQLNYSFTGRISSSLGFHYRHNENEPGVVLTASGPTTAEDLFYISLSARYRFNSRLAFDTSFAHTELITGQALREYSRNRYTVGLSFRF
jgi:putative salt-induced outer membrane protein YdiY